MKLSEELVQEINVLAMFDLTSTQVGIKVHHDASPELVAATQRLFNKDIITQADGGYLTGLGRDAAVHAKDLLTILTTV
jgi:uncharacterized protein (TIGR02647 family)